jgi:hypothetical protein
MAHCISEKVIGILKSFEEKVDFMEEGVQSIGTRINSLATSVDNGTIRLEKVQFFLALLVLLDCFA